jgi:hypothetical protein
MTLHVDFEHFAETAKRHLTSPFAYVSRLENRTHVTAADPATNLIISASSKLGLEEAKESLAASGIQIGTGGWSESSHGTSDSLGELPYIGVVAYKSSDEMPGVWVDAFPDPPTPATVLKAIYDEFRETGEVGDMSFEEFVRLANPNVIIASPTDLERFLSDKNGCE